MSEFMKKIAKIPDITDSFWFRNATTLIYGIALIFLMNKVHP